MCTVLNDYFLSVFTKEDVENVPIPQQMFQGTENDKLLDIIIKKDMVQKQLEELNSNNSQGPDEIHHKLLIELSSVIAGPLTKLFQYSLVQDVVPMIGKKQILLNYSRKVVKMLVRIVAL